MCFKSPNRCMIYQRCWESHARIKGNNFQIMWSIVCFTDIIPIIWSSICEVMTYHYFQEIAYVKPDEIYQYISNSFPPISI